MLSSCQRFWHFCTIYSYTSESLLQSSRIATECPLLREADKCKRRCRVWQVLLMPTTDRVMLPAQPDSICNLNCLVLISPHPTNSELFYQKAGWIVKKNPKISEKQPHHPLDGIWVGKNPKSFHYCCGFGVAVYNAAINFISLTEQKFVHD